jgi:hypothetical protein
MQSNTEVEWIISLSYEQLQQSEEGLYKQERVKLYPFIVMDKTVPPYIVNGIVQCAEMLGKNYLLYLLSLRVMG